MYMYYRLPDGSEGKVIWSSMDGKSVGVRINHSSRNTTVIVPFEEKRALGSFNKKKSTETPL